MFILKQTNHEQISPINATELKKEVTNKCGIKMVLFKLIENEHLS